MRRPTAARVPKADWGWAWGAGEALARPRPQGRQHIARPRTKRASFFLGGWSFWTLSGHSEPQACSGASVQPSSVGGSVVGGRARRRDVCWFLSQAECREGQGSPWQ